MELLPLWKDFCPFETLDEKSAAEHLLGKTIEEARAVIQDAPESLLEDFMWMGSDAFLYYFPALLDYFREDVQLDWDNLFSSLATSVLFRIDETPEDIYPFKDALLLVFDRFIQYSQTQIPSLTEQIDEQILSHVIEGRQAVLACPECKVRIHLPALADTALGLLGLDDVELAYNKELKKLLKDS